MGRIGFQEKEYRDNFFKDVKKDKFSTWEKLANHLGTSRAMLDHYRTGKILLSKDRFDKLCLFLDKEINENYSNKIFIKNNNCILIARMLKYYPYQKLLWQKIITNCVLQ